MCMLFEICEKRPFQKCMGWGGVGGHSFAHRAVQGRTHRAQAMVQGSLIIPNPIRRHRCPFPQGPGLHWGTHPRLAPNRRRCRLPEIHVVKPWWGALYDPKTGLQRLWPLQWTEPGVPCGCKQVVANRLYEAFWPSCQARPDSPAPTLHPQSVLFCVPKAFVVHRAKQQHVA